jgi:hypothetical protein
MVLNKGKGDVQEYASVYSVSCYRIAAEKKSEFQHPYIIICSMLDNLLNC